MRKTSLGAAVYITRGAAVAAIYFALTYLTSLLGLASGVIQFRISEALCILPIFIPEAILGLTIGCFLSNLITGALFWDVIFGSIATLIGAIGAYVLRSLPKKLIWLSTIPTVLSNAVIIPFVLIYAYGISGGYFFFMLTVGVGEIVCAGIGGALLCYSLSKTNVFKH